MNTSDLIKCLQDSLKREGDLEVMIPQYDSLTGPYKTTIEHLRAEDYTFEHSNRGTERVLIAYW